MRVFGTNFRPQIGLAAVICLYLLNSPGRANAPIPRPEPTRILPSQIGDFQVVGTPTEIRPNNEKEAGADPLKLIADGYYASGDGVHLRVSLFRWESDSAAYASLTTRRKERGPDSNSPVETVGTDSTLIDAGIIFFKGSSSVTVSAQNKDQRQRAVEFARLFASTLDKGEGEIPVLVKHLPNWETAQRQAEYFVRSDGLTSTFPGQPILKELNFEGGTEAVAANYGPSQVLIVEFTTPQLSVDNDSRIWTKIAELKSRGEPTPTAYRRVGNYSVFVFNAPDEKTASALVDQVKYEQLVQWLGDDPRMYERLQRYFRQTSAGVLVAVLKSSGLSLLLCLAAGVLIGTMMFRHRRAQKAAMYSDAGGSVRLNLDDLTGPANTRRLLQTGKPSEGSSSQS